VAFLITVALLLLGGAPATPAPAHARLAPPCAHRARAAISGGGVTAKPFTAPSGAAGCRLESSELSAIVMLDSAPQPYTRMEREQVELWQNVEWSHKTARAAPRPVGHLGLGGYWFPVQSRLLTTDGVRLVTIKVRSRTDDSARRKSLATRLAGIYLGPPHKPAGY
jgi:hypothetical protein